jgi:hypothetical protein
MHTIAALYAFNVLSLGSGKVLVVEKSESRLRRSAALFGTMFARSTVYRPLLLTRTVSGPPLLWPDALTG